MNRIIVTLFTALAITISACDFDAVVDAVDRFDLIIQLEAIDSYAVGQIVDARTGELIDADVNVKIGGRDRSNIVDFYGDRVDNIRARRGMFVFGVQPGIAPTESAPVRITLSLDVPGYESSNTVVEFDSEGEISARIELMPEAGQIEGSASASGTASANQSFSLRADADGSGAGLDVPAGAWLRSDGTVADGAVQARVRYHGPNSKALGSLPTPRLDSGELFAPLGYVTLDARDHNGSPLSTSSAATVSMSIPANAVNPQTGVAFSPGDALQVVSYGDETGTWSVTGTAVVEAAAGKRSGGSVIISGPSDRFAVMPGVMPTQEVEVRLDRNGHDGPVQVEYVSTSGYAFTVLRNVASGSNSRTFDIPVSAIPGEFRFNLQDGTTSTARLDQPGPSLHHQLPVSQWALEDVSVDLQLSCTIKLKPPFNASLYYRLASGRGLGSSAGVPTWTTDSHGRVNGGSLTIPDMIIGERYRFTLVTPDETGWEEIDVTTADMIYNATIPTDLCVR